MTTLATNLPSGFDGAESSSGVPERSAFDILTHDLGFRFQADESGEKKEVYRRGEVIFNKRGAQILNDACLTIERLSENISVVSLYIDCQYAFSLRLRCSSEKARDLALKFTVDWIRSTH